MNFKHLLLLLGDRQRGRRDARGRAAAHDAADASRARSSCSRRGSAAACSARAAARLELTDEGRAALEYADQIFALGEELEAAMGKARAGPRALDFRVGVADSVPKAIAYRLLEPALDAPGADPADLPRGPLRRPARRSSRCTRSIWCSPTSR